MAVYVQAGRGVEAEQLATKLAEAASASSAADRLPSAPRPVVAIPSAEAVAAAASVVDDDDALNPDARPTAQSYSGRLERARSANLAKSPSKAALARQEKSPGIVTNLSRCALPPTGPIPDRQETAARWS